MSRNSKVNIQQIDSEKTLTSIEEFGSSHLFLSSAWCQILDSKHFKLIGIYNLNSELIGLFYYFVYSRKKILIQVDAPPLTPYCFLDLKELGKTNYSITTFRKDVMKEIAIYLSELRCDVGRFVFPGKFNNLNEFSALGFETKVKYTFLLDLTQSEEELLSHMSSERRRNINKGLKSNLIIIENGAKEDLLALIEATFRREKLKLPENFLQKVIFEFSHPSNSFFYIAYSNNRPIACSFFVYDKQKTYYLLGGYNSEHKNDFAGPLCMWNGILKSKQLQIPMFDFEGSQQAKIESYFRGFGGALTAIPYVQKTSAIGSIIKK